MYITDSYLFFLLLSVPYYFYKNGFSKISIFIFLIFWQGLFATVGDVVFNVVKMVIVAFALIVFHRGVFTNYSPQQRRLGWSFLLFTIVFWVSYMLYGGDINTISSQYFYKYGMVVLIFNGLYHISRYKIEFDAIKKIILNVLLIQSVLSVIKMIIYGFSFEAIVGTMSEKGAGLAVVIPLIALIFFWVIKQGEFKTLDYFRIASFFIIALASGKRAPVVIFPVVLLVLHYTKQGKSIFTLVKYIPLALLIFYFGVKLTPSLNPEDKVWGSFSPQHVVEYAIYYNFGTVDYAEILEDGYETSSRGGAIFLFFDPKKAGLSDLQEIVFGKGLYEVVVQEFGRFQGGAYQGFQHQGLASGLLIILYTLGFGGVITLLLISFSVLRSISEKRLFFLCSGLFLWEALIYYNQILFAPASSFILIYAIFARNKFLEETLLPFPKEAKFKHPFKTG